jgi:hypothetical protein
MDTTIILNAEETAELFKQDPGTAGDGGYQSLLVSLQGKVNRANGQITLTLQDRERIRRYAFDYGNGGWEDRLVAIFGRTLGPKLDQ